MLTLLVSLQQKNVKKSEKSMKIVNIEKEKIFMSSEQPMKLSEKMWLLIILKVLKNQSFTLSLENLFLEKP